MSEQVLERAIPPSPSQALPFLCEMTAKESAALNHGLFKHKQTKKAGAKAVSKSDILI